MRKKVMKKFRRLLNVTMLATLFVSLGIVCAWADAPMPLESLKAYPTNNSVTLKWKSVEGAEGYKVYQKNKGNWKLIKKIKQKGSSYEYEVKGLNRMKAYRFAVSPYNAEGEAEMATIKEQPMREMTYDMTMKASESLPSRGRYSGSGKRTGTRVYGGQDVTCNRFSGGFYFFVKNDNIYQIQKTHVRNISANYTTKMNYPKYSVEKFVNSRKIGSKTRNLILVSTYCQHVYVFKGKKGKWKLIDNWECSTGRPETPTPTGKSGKKVIGRKFSFRQGVPYWSTFSSLNAFHGKINSWVLGNPASGGCIRNPNDKAHYIYDSVRIGTGVYLF